MFFLAEYACYGTNIKRKIIQKFSRVEVTNLHGIFDILKSERHGYTMYIWEGHASSRKLILLPPCNIWQACPHWCNTPTQGHFSCVPQLIRSSCPPPADLDRCKWGRSWVHSCSFEIWISSPYLQRTVSKEVNKVNGSRFCNQSLGISSIGCIKLNGRNEDRLNAYTVVTLHFEDDLSKWKFAVDTVGQGSKIGKEY